MNKTVIKIKRPVLSNGKNPTETNSTSSKMINREQQKFKKKEPDQSPTVVEKVNTLFFSN